MANRVARPTSKHWQGEALTDHCTYSSRIQRFPDASGWHNFLVISKHSLVPSFVQAFQRQARFRCFVDRKVIN